MTCEHNWAEEEIIDGALGNLSDAKQKQLDKHLLTCDSCSDLYDQWTAMFDEKTKLGEHPSVQLKEAVMEKVRDKNVKKKKALNPIWLLPVAAAILVMVFSHDLFPKQMSTPSNLASNQSHLNETPFIVNEGTTVYDVIPTAASNVTGYAWVNRDSNELFVIVNGLTPVMEKDYQAWIQTSSHIKNVGLIDIVDGKGQLYIRQPEVNYLKYMILSLEPQGGSRQPTDPNATVIQLNNKQVE